MLKANKLANPIPMDMSDVMNLEELTRHNVLQFMCQLFDAQMGNTTNTTLRAYFADGGSLI